MSAVHAVTAAESPSEAIGKIKGAGYRFHMSENVLKDTMIIRPKVIILVYVSEFPLTALNAANLLEE